MQSYKNPEMAEAIIRNGLRLTTEIAEDLIGRTIRYVLVRNGVPEQYVCENTIQYVATLYNLAEIKMPAHAKSYIRNSLRRSEYYNALAGFPCKDGLHGIFVGEGCLSFKPAVAYFVVVE